VTLGVKRGFPKLGDAAFPGHQNFNEQITKFIAEGGQRPRLPLRAAGAVRAWRRRADRRHPPHQSTERAGHRAAAPQARRAFILDTWTL
jgi:hypothetical protein